MGRMLDVLQQAETRRDDGAAAAAPAEEDFVSDFANEEVPFIEVGPARSLEASSGVLAARPPQLRIAPQPPPDVGPLLHLPADAGPAVGVCLRPLSGGLALLPPEQRFAADLIAFHQPDHPAGADYRQLAAAIQEGTTSGQSRVLLCLGASQGVGTTSVVLNLGICLAAGGGMRVVVVDADEARPAIAERLGLRGAPGLAEVLAGSESLDRALQETGLPSLTALTAGRPEPVSAPGRAGEAWRPVLRQLRDRFDVVLLDAGSDASGLGNACDAAYLVAPHSHAEAPATAERVRALLRKGTALRGCILTGHCPGCRAGRGA
jgi:Mrp family chromosome partitioning ATPase